MQRSFSYKNELIIRSSREFHSHRHEFVINQTYRQLFSGTLYNILIPIGYSNKEKSSDYEHEPFLFSSAYLDKIINVNQINLSRTIFTTQDVHTAQKEKEAQVESVGKWIFEKCFYDTSDIIYQLNINFKVDKTYMEIFTKGFMWAILNRKNRLAHKIAIVFDMAETESIQAIKHFANYMSLFFVNLNDKQKEMIQLSQIAVCSRQNNMLVVNFILTGSDPDTMYATAIHYAYHNFNISRRFLNMLKLIMKPTRATESRKSTLVPSLFPFDLYLSENEKPWFLNILHEQLNQDLRMNRHEGVSGCCIDNIHFKVNDNTHMHRFYAVDLLLNNLSNIYRFAYVCCKSLIANIMKLEEKPKQILVIGYREYTSILIHQIMSFLRSYLETNNDSLKIYGGYVGYDIDGREAFYPLCNIEKNDYNACKFAFITPVGITFHSFDDIVRTASKYLKHNIREADVILKQCLFATIFNDTKDIFGDVDQYGNYFLSLNNQVYYFGMIKSTGTLHASGEKCSDCYPVNPTQELLLVAVNNITSKPNKIFPVFTSSKLLESDVLFESNITVLENKLVRKLKYDVFSSLLENCLIYHHVKRKENYFQYYIDTKKLYLNLLNSPKKELHKWVEYVKKTLRTRDSATYAFNILVAPEHESNSGFVEFVANNIFGHNIKFVHFPIDDTYREDVRSQLAYISRDIRYINETFHDSVLNIYFVDDAINTATSFNLMKRRMEMLIREAFYGVSSVRIRINLFDAAFILINRLSPDSIKTLMRTTDICFELTGNTSDNLIRSADIKEHFFSVLDIPIPSLRTKSDKCPSCDLVRMFEEIEKRSSTNMLAKIAQRKKAQNELYDVSKCKLCREDGNSSETICNAKIKCQRLEPLFSQILAYQSVLEYRDTKNFSKISDFYTNVRNAILIFLVDFSNVHSKGKVSEYEKLDWLRFNIKALSRPLLSSYHHVGQETLSIILNIIEGLVEPTFTVEDELVRGIVDVASIKKDDSAGLIDKKQHLFLVLLKQVASMGSAYVLREDTMFKIFTYFSTNYLLRSVNKRTHRENFPFFIDTLKEFGEYYLSVVMMSMRERNVCADENIINMWVEKIINVQADQTFGNNFIEALFIENSQGLYNRAKQEKDDVQLLYNICNDKREKKTFTQFCKNIKTYIESLEFENNVSDRAVERVLLFGTRNPHADSGLLVLQPFTDTLNINIGNIVDMVYDINLHNDWIMDTYNIGREVNGSPYDSMCMRALVSIAYKKVLPRMEQENMMDDVEHANLYIYIKFMPNATRLDILKILRKILFLRNDIMENLEHFSPHISEIMERTMRDKWLIVKELYDRISSKENGHYSLHSADGDESKCLLALQYAKRLFDELNYIDGRFVELERIFEGCKNMIVNNERSGDRWLQLAANNISEILEKKLAMYYVSIEDVIKSICIYIDRCWEAEERPKISFDIENDVETFNQLRIYWTEAFDAEIQSIIADIKKYGKCDIVNVNAKLEKNGFIAVSISNKPINCASSNNICIRGCKLCEERCDEKRAKIQRPSIVEMTEFINDLGGGSIKSNPVFESNCGMFCSKIYTRQMKKTWKRWEAQ